MTFWLTLAAFAAGIIVGAGAMALWLPHPENVK